MTLFIQDDSGTVGAGTVIPSNATLNLMQIGNVENTDADYGEDALPDPSDLFQVTYILNTATGPCPTRLDTLVNTNFGVNPENIDIIILAGDGGFTLNDGEMLSNVGGVALRPGETHNGVNFNPTTSHYVIYESGGGTNCVKGEASGDYDAPDPSSVILYHELSHAFRQANAASLDGTEPSACGTSAEERAAEVDENDMRDQLGIARRDVGDHCGDPGCGTCCIVASIASGSTYSAEVNALRQVRDHFLRRSNVGFDFFDQLFDDYYNFSPEICRMMAASPDLTHLIEIYFVMPLTRCLTLIQNYTLGGLDYPQLGARFFSDLEASPELASMSIADLRRALDLLSGMTDESVTLGPSLDKLWLLLDARARSSDFVRWALMDTIEIYVNALIWRLEGFGPDEIGQRLAEKFEQWGPQMPLTETWKSLSSYAVAQELAFLKQSLLRTGEARLRFGERLVNHLGKDNNKASSLLFNAGFFGRGM